MELTKLLIVDFTEIFHQSVFIKRKVPKLSVPYFMLRKLFKIIKAFPDRKVICICDGKHSWRKNVYPLYKMGRQEVKDKQTDIDWGYHYQEMDVLLDNLVAYTPMVVLKEVGLESDDWASYLVRHGEDTILCSSDHDMDQLCLFPGVQLVSLKSPKLKPLRVKDPIGSLNDKIKNGCLTDKVPKANTPEQESINRIIVTLTSLPVEIDQKMEKILAEYKESLSTDQDLQAFANCYTFKFLLGDLRKLFGDK
jgi:hypothetical protein